MNTLIKISGLALAGLMAARCATKAELPRENWNDDVYGALSKVIAEDGKASKDYNPDCRPYAVFDFDNTTIMNDITMSLMIYQVENMKFAFPPEKAFDAFTAWLPDLDTVMTKVGMSARELGNDMTKDYTAIREMEKAGKSIEEIHETAEYLDFRAKALGLEIGVEYTFSYETWSLWSPTLLTDMTYAELTALTKEAADYWVGLGKIWKEQWVSPDGKVTVEVMKGLQIPQESIDLYKTLSKNGFDVYICSASLEAIVESVACDPKYGLGLDPEHVFGLRMEDPEYVGGDFQKGYDQTFLEGKVACIRKLIAPRHCSKSPSLVAGDSSGDYPMLTSFEDLKVGLIIDCQNSGNIAKLTEKAKYSVAPRYVVQGRDLSIPGYIQ